MGSFTNPYPASRLTVDSTNPLVTGMQLWFPFTTGTGTSAPCLFHASHNGTLQSGASWASSDIGTVLELDGSSEVDFTSDISRNKTAVSCSAWIKPDSVSGNNFVFYEENGTNTHRTRFGLAVADGRVRCGGRDDDSDSFTNFAQSNTSTVVTGVWQHAVAVFDPTGGGCKVFLDGVDVTASSDNTGDGFPDTASLNQVIGGIGGHSSFYFDGQIQNLRVYDRALSATEVATLYHRPWEGTNYGDIWPYSPPSAGSMTLSSDAAATSLNSGCVHWWPLTGDAADVTTTADNLTATGTPTWVSSDIGTGVELVSNTTYLTSSTYGNTYQVNTPITISAWVKFATSLNNGGMLQYADVHTNGTPLYLLQQNGANLRWYARGTYSSNMSAAVGEWHHVALTNNGSTIDCYLNGEYENTLGGSSTAGEDANNKFWIGAGWKNQYTYQFQNVRIWDRALSAEEISILHERPWEGEASYGDAFHHDPPDPASMLPLTSDSINQNQELWYPLTDGTSTTAVDISGAGNDGTLSSAAGWATSSLGTVLALDGQSNSYATTPLLSSSVNQPHTHSVWFRTSDTSGYMIDRHTLFANGTFVRISSSTLEVYAGTTVALGSANQFNDNQWHNVVAVFNDTNSAFYVDGVLISSSNPGTRGWGGSTIGARSNGAARLAGDLQNYRVWSRALTENEIWSIYATNPWLGSNYKLASGSTLYNYIFRTERFRRLG